MEVAAAVKVNGQLIRELREQNMMTQEELGQKVGAGQEYISQIENGKPVGLKMLAKLRVALGCLSIDELLIEEE
jgi:transcriptional regulator with XRE-family HTH domain